MVSVFSLDRSFSVSSISQPHNKHLILAYRKVISRKLANSSHPLDPSENLGTTYANRRDYVEDFIEIQGNIMCRESRDPL